MTLAFPSPDPDAESTGLLGHLQFQEGLQEFIRGLSKVKKEHLDWPEAVDIIDWVYRHIVLQKGESSRVGNMKLTVYQREVARQVDNPLCTQVTVLKGVQIGYSKLLKAVYAYVVGYLAKRASVAFPTKENIVRFWKDEISEMYKEVKPLARILRDAERGTASDTMAEQRFTNGAVGYFRSAFNEADLQSFTCWLMMADEVDRPGWQPRGNSAGDKLNQFRNRGTDLFGSKLIVGSTPGVRHLSVIYPEWLKSDQRRLRVNCPHCGQEQELRWSWQEGDKTRFGFEYEVNDAGQVLDAWYVCDSEKRCKIVQDDRDDMVDAGRYISTKVAEEPGNVGIHVPSWISPSPGAAWVKICQKWVLAQGDVERLKEFVCFWMAEPWDEFDSRSFTGDRVSDRAQPYPAEVPDDVVVIVAGGDDQTNKEGNTVEKLASREISVVGFNRRKEPRLICHRIVLGDVGDPAADAEYRAILDRPYLRRDGKPMYIQATAMDMGGHHPDETRRFAASFPKSRNVWAIRGSSHAAGTRLPTMWPKSEGGAVIAKLSAKKEQFFTIDTQRARDVAAAKLLLEGDNAPMFPSSVSDQYFEKLTCEHQVKQKNGGYWWTHKKNSRSEEEWACFVYAFVALEGLQLKRAKWKDLNLAATTAGIPDICSDPETGELDYEGPDMSVQGVEARAAAEPVAVAVIQKPRPKRTAEPTIPAELPKPPAVPPSAPVVPLAQPQQLQPRRPAVARTTFWNR